MDAVNRAHCIISGVPGTAAFKYGRRSDGSAGMHRKALLYIQIFWLVNTQRKRTCSSKDRSKLDPSSTP